MTTGTADADFALVRSLQAGEDSSMDLLMERHQEPLYRFIRGYIVNEADAVELTQEAFVRPCFNIRKFKPSVKFTTWLYQIALNLCRDHAKSRRSKQAALTDSLTPTDREAVAESEWAASPLSMSSGTAPSFAH